MTRSVLRIALIVAALAASALAARAGGFVTTDLFAGNVTSVVSNGQYIFVGRSDFPSILVFDPKTSTQVTELSLVTASTSPLPTGVTAMAAQKGGRVIVGALPNGRLYSISTDLGVSQLDTLPVIDTTNPYSRINAMRVHRDGTVFIGARHVSDTAELLLRNGSLSTFSISTISLGGENSATSINALASLRGQVAVGTTDSEAVGLGRLYIFNDTPGTAARHFLGALSVTAVVATADTFLFATTAPGQIRDMTGTVRAAVAENRILTMEFGRDGQNDTVVFFSTSANNALRRLGTDFTVNSLGSVNAAATSIEGLAFHESPERVYGVARRATGSLLFYYDNIPPIPDPSPTTTQVTFSIDSTLRQPYTPDTLQVEPIVTWGRYKINLRVTEKLREPPTVQLRFADGSLQTVPMTGSNVDYSGEVTIDHSRVPGEARVLVTAIDDAGNVGTLILLGSKFTLRDIAPSVVANNLIRPIAGEFCTVRYTLRTPQDVKIRVYNTRGQEVRDLSPGPRFAGQYQDVRWEGRNSFGKYVSSGVYLIRIDAGSEYSSTHKVMLVR